MLKEVLAPLREKGYILRRFEPFSPKTIGSRKRISIFHGIDIHDRYLLVFVINKKSRVLSREAGEWIELKSLIERYYGYSILLNIALIKAPVCFKAVSLLESEGWKVIIE